MKVTLLAFAFIVLVQCKSSLGTITIPLVRHRKPVSIHATANKGDELLKSIDGFYYVGEAYLGTPPQRFRLLFETGNGAFWVYSSKICGNIKKACNNHRKFRSERSTTYSTDDKEFSYEFDSNLDRYYKGILAKEVLSVGGLVVRDLDFVEVTDVDDITTRAMYDGSAGLGLVMDGGQLYSDVTPLIFALMNSGQLKSSIFSVYFNKIGTRLPSIITFGGIAYDRFIGDFVDAVLFSKDRWVVNIDSINVGGKQVSLSINAALQTGGTAMSGPKNVINSIIKAIGATINRDDGLYYVQCSELQSLPNITLTVSGVDLTMTPPDYVVTFDDSTKGMSCWCGLQVAPNSNIMNLGATFFRTFYTVFNVEERKVSFAKAV